MQAGKNAYFWTFAYAQAKMPVFGGTVYEGAAVVEVHQNVIAAGTFWLATLLVHRQAKMPIFGPFPGTVKNAYFWRHRL